MSWYSKYIYDPIFNSISGVDEVRSTGREPPPPPTVSSYYGLDFTSAPPMFEDIKPEPLTSKYRGFIPEPAADYGRRAHDAFYNTPSLATHTGELGTPASFLRADFVTQYINQFGVHPTEEQVDAALKTAFDHMTGVKAGNPLTVSLTRKLLAELKGQSPVGDSPNKAFAGQTLAERAARRHDAYQDGRHMRSAGLDTQLGALRAYTLLGALEESPELQLPMFDGTGMLNSLPAQLWVGSPYDFERGEWIWGNRDYDPVNDSGAGVRHLTALRMFLNDEDPVLARQLEALYWDRLAEKKRPEGQYKSALEGAYYWPYSYQHMQGMGRESEENWANNMTHRDRGIAMYMMDPGVWGGEQGAALSELGGLINREVPIIPATSTAAETKEARDRFRRLTSQTDDALIDNYPLWQEQWNKWMPGEAFDVQQYSRPSPAANNFLTAPFYSLDTPTMASMGMAAPGALARGGIRELATSMAKDTVVDTMTTEQGYGAGLYNLHSGGDWARYFTPYASGNVTDIATGQSADPGKPGASNYRANWEFYKHDPRGEQQSNIRWLMDYHKRHIAGKPQNEPNMPSLFGN